MFLMNVLNLYLPKYVNTYFTFSKKRKDIVMAHHFLFFLKLYIIFASPYNYKRWISEFEQNYYQEKLYKEDYYAIILDYFRRVHPREERYYECCDWFIKKYPYLRWKHWYVRYFFKLIDLFNREVVWRKWRRYRRRQNYVVIAIVVYIFIFLLLLVLILLK